MTFPGEEAGERCAQYFRAHTFAALLEKDPFGRISISTFFKYVMRREWLKQVKLSIGQMCRGEILEVGPSLNTYLARRAGAIRSIRRMDAEYYIDGSFML